MSGLQPHDCEECACLMFDWNGRRSVVQGDPPRTCTCGHPVFRHRFKVAA